MEGRRVDSALHVAVHVRRHDVRGDGLLRRGEGDIAGDFSPRPVLHDEQRLAAAPARKGAHGVRLGRVEPDESVAPVDRRQRGMFAPQARKLLHERVARAARRAVELRPVHRRLPEHGMAFVRVRKLVAAEEERHAVEREHPREDLVDGVEAPGLLAARARVGRDVVVFVVVHEAGTDGALSLAADPGRPHRLRREAGEPAVVGVEALVLVADGETLAEKHRLARAEGVHHVVRVAPEVERDAVADVTAEAVRAERAHQVRDVPDQVRAQRGDGEVELREAPGALLDRAVRVPPREFGMLAQERRRGAAVEVDEIEDDLQAEAVGLPAEILQVLVRPVFLVDVEVVGDAVLVLRVVEAAADLARTPERLVAGIVHLHDRHEVRDRHAEVLQVGELPRRRPQRALGRERPGLDLVHHALGEPLRALPRVLHPRIRAKRTRREQQRGHQHPCSHGHPFVVFNHSRTSS